MNRSRIMLFLTLFVLATMLFVMGVRPYASVGLVLIPLSYVLGLYAYKNYATWSSGTRGEEKVLAELKKLGDEYALVRNAVIPPSKGDIDHIIVGPNGIFVVETKNAGGVIECDGDNWYRHKVGRRGGRYDLGIGSPSRQAKRSAKTLKDFILKNSRMIFGGRTPHVWVYSILVFTNNSIILKLRNPTVYVVSTGELNDFILGQKDVRISGETVDRMTRLISGV